MAQVKWIAGVDEAGRGPLAGPVVAAAVILDPTYVIAGLADSKKLTERMRERLFDEICAHALCYSIAKASVEEIDSHNILQASLLAMKRSVEGLSHPPTQVLVDGLHTFDYPAEVLAIVKGDQKEACISAASILAKVTRDREMVAMDARYPGYGFAQHKGYPTKSHCAALDVLGVSEIHRVTFSPVARVLENA